MVDVDSNKGCAVQTETVFRCSARDSMIVCGQAVSLYSRTSDGLKTCTVDLKERRRECNGRCRLH